MRSSLLRTGELRVEDIDIEKQAIEVDTAKRDDDDSDRTLRFNLTLKNELDKRLSAGREQYKPAEGSPYHLPTKESTKILPRNLTQSIRSLAEDAGVQDYNDFQKGGKRAEITPHGFGKSFGTRRWRESELKTASKLLDHKNVSITEEYLQLEDVLTCV